MKALDQIYTAYKGGGSALLVTGRDWEDLDIDDDGGMRPLSVGFRRAVRAAFGMQVIDCSLAGVDWDPSGLDQEDRRTIDGALAGRDLAQLSPDHNHAVRILRGISALARAQGELRWQDGRPLRLCFVFHWAEHIFPATAQSDASLVAAEEARKLAQSLALRASQNLVVFLAREGLADDLVTSALHHIHLRQPGPVEKEAFVRLALNLHEGAVLESGLSPELVGGLLATTPNRGLEERILASELLGSPVSSRELAEQRSRDIAHISEGSLAALDTSRVDGIELAGRGIEIPKAYLTACADGLRRADPHTPAAVMLAGPPGTGKTLLAILVAKESGAAAVEVMSPKRSLVGETERVAKLQQTVLGELGRAVAVMDEGTDTHPMERSDFNGDSGASSAVHAAQLSGLADEQRRGKSITIATTNVPYRMSAAMRSRFMMVPVLYPAADDFPAIVAAVCRSVDPTSTVTAQDQVVVEAARRFYDKGAGPREVRKAISQVALFRDRLDADAVAAAAVDFCGSADLASVVLADLWAVRLCSSFALLPWSANPPSYPYPQHFEGIVDQATGAVDYRALDKRIEEIRPYANV